MRPRAILTRAFARGLWCLFLGQLLVATLPYPSQADLGDIQLRAPVMPPSQGTEFTIDVVVDVESRALGAYEIRVPFNPAALEFVAVDPGDPSEFAGAARVATAELALGRVHFGAYQGASRTSPTGEFVVARLRMRALAPPGTELSLALEVIQLLEPRLIDIPPRPTGALVVINTLPLGDINGDGVAYQVSDAVYLTRALLGFGPLNSAESSASNVNGDAIGESIADLVFLINVLLGTQDPLKSLEGGGPTNREIIARLGAPQPDGEWSLVPVYLPSSIELGGVLLRLDLGDTHLALGAPRPGPRAQGMHVNISEHGDVHRILVYSLEGKRVAGGEEPLLWLPIRGAERSQVSEVTQPSSGAGNVRLTAVELSDTAGHFVRSAIEDGDVRIERPVSRVVLHPNFPNPFNPRTELRFDLPQNSRTRLVLYDAAGRRVRVLVDRQMTAGRYRVEWDGTDERGHGVASGIYFARLETTLGVQATRKMVLVR